MTARSITLPAILAAAGMGCSNSPTGPTYTPQIPTDWVSAVTNPYWLLVPGTVLQYESRKPEGLETVTITVLAAPRVVNGVSSTEVHDQVFLDGSLIEDTYDWYAQNGAGDVWYLGEDSKQYLNGQVIGTTGSWEWGVSGALPGIQMWGDPAAHLGEEYRQEYLKGVAEDFGKVVALGQPVIVPAGSFTGCIAIEDWVGLDPAQSHENKYYCPQFGLVESFHLEAGDPHVRLLSKTP